MDSGLQYVSVCMAAYSAKDTLQRLTYSNVRIDHAKTVYFLSQWSLVDRIDPTSRSRIWKPVLDSYLCLSKCCLKRPKTGSRTMSILLSKYKERDRLSYEAISRAGICNHEDDGEQSILHGWSACTEKKRSSRCGFAGDGVPMFRVSSSSPCCGWPLS